jgi:hypothetical protein
MVYGPEIRAPIVEGVPVYVVDLNAVAGRALHDKAVHLRPNPRPERKLALREIRPPEFAPYRLPLMLGYPLVVGVIYECDLSLGKRYFPHLPLRTNRLRVSVTIENPAQWAICGVILRESLASHSA